MEVHVLVTVCQGEADTVQLFEDRQAADLAEVAVKKELGIETGKEAESDFAVELFFDVPIIFREKGVNHANCK